MSKKKTYVARIYLGRDENGKQLFEWVGRFDLKRQRDDAVAKRRVELQQEQATVFPACDAYVDRYLAEYARSHKESSHHTTSERLRRFRDDFAGRSLDIPRHVAKDWAAKVPAGCVHAVITLYNHAIDEDDLPLAKNPFRKLGERTKGRAEDPPPSEQEFQALLDACAVHKEYAPRMRAFLLFAAFTLMRPSELFALEWADIDFDTMRIEKARRLYRGKLAEPKTGPKTIALTPPARDAILGQPRTSSYVFTSKTGKRLSSTNFWGYWSQVTARAGLDFDLYHATKHYGTWYLWTKLHLSRRALAAQSGWSVRSVDAMLARYGHGDVGALEEIDRAFEGNVVPMRPKAVGD
jgi:integrase